MSWSFDSGSINYGADNITWSTVAGDLLIVGVQDANSVTGTLTVSDTAGNTWTRIGSQISGTNGTCTWFWAVANATSSTTVTVANYGFMEGLWRAQYHSSLGNIAANALQASTQRNVANNAGSTASNGDTSLNATPTSDGCLIVGWIFNDQVGGNGSSFYSVGTSFNLRTNCSHDSTAGERIWEVEDRVQTTAAAAAATWTSINTNGYTAFVAFFAEPVVEALIGAFLQN